MRFMRIGNVYETYWRQFYSRNPGLERKSYAEQFAALLYDAFSQSDSYCHYLGRLGYECQEVVANPIPLQRRWAKENGIPWDPRSFVQRHALEMARRFKPEIVFLNDFYSFGAAWVRELRGECPSVRMVLGWSASPLKSLELLRGYDLVLTSSPVLRDEYRSAGLCAELLRHAFDPRVLERIQASRTKTLPVSFVGGVQRKAGFHDYRAQVIERVLRDVDAALYCGDREEGLVKTCVKKAVFTTARALRRCGLSQTACECLPVVGKAAGWERKPLFRWEDPLRRRNRGALFGLRMYQSLADSRVTLNVHGGVAGDYTGNIRLFEATGVGTCLLTDWKKDLHELFEPESEVVSFRSPDECAEKARWLLDRPDDCRRIAEAGQERTLANHTYANRAEQLDHIIRAHLPSADVPA
jgi:spore maturation protein CgeB